VGVTCGIVLSAAAWLLPQGLSRDGRIALMVLALAVVGWAMTRIGDTVIALAATLALAGTGVISAERLFGTLGHEMIWLLVAAFVISAVLRASGLIELVLAVVLGRLRTVRQLFLGLTGLISATAFVIPSTSGRAALLLPVFLDLAGRIGTPSIVRALALLFPTVILLSAAASLTGAGAHVVAVDFIERVAHERIDWLGWMVLGLPFALLSSTAAAATILGLFLTAEEASQPVRLEPARRVCLTREQIPTAAITSLLLGLWVTAPVHGMSITLVALIAALVLLFPGVSPLPARDAFKAVNVELIVFLAATLAIAGAVSQSGADRWLAQRLVDALPTASGLSTPVTVAVVGLVSMLAHLVIASRTARATILIPCLALPLAQLGHDPKLLVLVTVMGTGFCQTLPASAKPVVIFACTEQPTYTTGDLLRLSAVLLPPMFLLLMLFALFVWP
jgi:anion transporter